MTNVSKKEIGKIYKSLEKFFRTKNEGVDSESPTLPA